MNNHQILTFEAHRELRVRSDHGADLGDGVMSCFVTPIEFRRVQNEFPILFHRDLESGAFSALALFGFEPGENLFLEGSRWDARYKPLALAIQPFLIGRAPGDAGPGQVHIDLDHPRIDRTGEGIRLFDDSGAATPYLDHVAAMLGELEAGIGMTGDFYSALDRHRLLEPCSVDIELDDGAKHRLVGYHLISEERLRALDPAALAELHAGDHLMPIFMALASLSNLAALARRRSASANND